MFNTGDRVMINIGHITGTVVGSLYEYIIIKRDDNMGFGPDHPNYKFIPKELQDGTGHYWITFPSSCTVLKPIQSFENYPIWN